VAAVRAWLTTELALPLAEIEVSGHSRTLAQATYPSREMRIAAIRSEGSGSDSFTGTLSVHDFSTHATARSRQIG